MFWKKLCPWFIKIDKKEIMVFGLFLKGIAFFVHSCRWIERKMWLIVDFRMNFFCSMSWKMCFCFEMRSSKRSKYQGIAARHSVTEKWSNCLNNKHGFHSLVVLEIEYELNFNFKRAYFLHFRFYKAQWKFNMQNILHIIRAVI